MVVGVSCVGHIGVVVGDCVCVMVVRLVSVIVGVDDAAIVVMGGRGVMLSCICLTNMCTLLVLLFVMGTPVTFDMMVSLCVGVLCIHGGGVAGVAVSTADVDVVNNGTVDIITPTNHYDTKTTNGIRTNTNTQRGHWQCKQQHKQRQLQHRHRQHNTQHRRATAIIIHTTKRNAGSTVDTNATSQYAH